MFFLSCVCYAFVRVCLFVPCHRSPAGKGLTSWLSFVIVSIPDLCTLTYLDINSDSGYIGTVCKLEQ